MRVFFFFFHFKKSALQLKKNVIITNTKNFLNLMKISIKIIIKIIKDF